jgi:NAD(P)-dependent dehydrogenase (short-subunit alcohol dehydrogenase family)
MKDKVVVVTGGAKGIGKAICDGFKEQGAKVCTIDILPNDYFVGDIAEEAVLKEFSEKVLKEYGKIDYLINNAMLSKGGIDHCTYEDFNYALRIGVSAPYYLSKLFMDHFREGGSIVNISSTRYAMSQANTESYTAAKGGITALTHALAISLAGTVRVNAIAPGWIDTTGTTFSEEDHKQQPVGRIGVPEDIVNAVLFLCSDKSSFITGQVIPVDGGMTKLMIYHNDNGWNYSL